ncbi:HU family DNA-binding protein [Streptomyces murinus]|uniref:HU family DNA-binding protein n=1 Tax=Streptomyces murinus TaxID=33900 RepID=UPI003F46A722
MNKRLLIKAVEAQIGSRDVATKAVEAVFDTIVRAVTAGERVRVTGFGSIYPAERPGQMKHNPQTGDSSWAEATTTVRFRPGTSFLALVSGDKQLPEQGSAIKKAPKTPRS